VGTDAPLIAALADSQRLGMLGDSPVEEIVEHAGAFVGALAGVAGTVVDLGSGGGVPGLVIARARPDLRVVLVDRRSRRTDHLRRLVGRLGLGARVEVLELDAAAVPIADAGAVVARGFGPPAATLRAAAPLLRPGGLVIVSEPPPDVIAGSPGSRWPRPLLAEVGLVPLDHDDVRVAVFRRAAPGQRP
jgi:16S rRNA (guanine527-N7)-methyltransferase